jgi:hypothetical protein
MKKIFILSLVTASLLIQAKSMSPGELDGYYSTADATRSMSDWYDIRYIVPGSLADTINIDSTFGFGTLVKSFVNMSSRSGYVVFKTSKGAVYQKYYLDAWQSTPKLPSVKFILKATTTIDTLGCFIQKFNQ